MISRRLLPLAALLVSCATACASSAETGETAASGGSPPVGPLEQPGPEATCEQYVRCVAATNPGGLGIIEEQYGADGTCWKNTPELCDGACLTGLLQSRTAFPNEPACPKCVADRHCTEAPLLACGADGACAECSSDHHCSGTTALCDGYFCVECLDDADCAAPTPRCLFDVGECVACNLDADCAAPTPGCALPAHECVPCSRPEHCPSGDCEADGHCCEASSCEQLADVYGCSLYGVPACGPIQDQSCNGTVDCGPCAQGTCNNFCCF